MSAFDFKSLSIRALLLAGLWLALAGFRPFAPIPSVCPNCAEKGDKLTLPDGRVLLANIIAKNQDGWIVERFGELRFIQFAEIKKVDWQAGAEPRGLDGYDQILLKNKDQTVLHGTLIQVEAGKPLALRSPKGNVYTVFAPQALLFYQKGQRKAPPKETAAPPPAAAPDVAPASPAPATPAPAGKP